MARIVLVLALGCAHPTPGAPILHSPTTGIPPTAWTIEFERCEAAYVEPAALCVRGRVMDYDGCRWRCVPAPVEGARQ